MTNKKNNPSMEKNNLYENEELTLSQEEQDLLPKVITASTAREPKNLLDAMRTVLESAKNSSLSDEYFENVKVPMAYLCRRLSLNPTQVTLLSIIMELGFCRCVNLGGIARYLDTTNLEIVEKSADITTLLIRRFVVEEKGRFDSGYTAPREVYDAFRNNQVYAYKVPELRNDDELVDRIDRMLSKLDSDFENEIVTFDRDLRDMILTNSHLRLARTLLGVLKKTTDTEFRVAVLMSMFWIRDEDNEIAGHRFSIVINRPMEVRQLVTKMLKGQSNLIKKKIVMMADGEGILNKDTFSLTPQFRKLLTPDRTPDSNDEERWAKRLTPHAYIQEKQLFYNPEAKGEVERLTQLLQPEQMDGVLARLKERGLRGGFTCLLYGGPGTGKTETVLQLARHSGRDIFQIDVSQLRSKWYGESERLVKGVFDEYRQMVKKRQQTGGKQLAPIMFFNEADAIFNRRMENAERSVDKSENALQNIILQEMETLDGILIATTNLQGNLDSAFERRFLYKLRLDNPTTEVKARIWQSMLPDLTEREARLLAEEFDFSGGQIENVVRKRFIDEVMSGEKSDLEAIQTLCRHEQLADTRRQNIGFMRYEGSTTRTASYTRS